jgi:hypothetical protein
MKELAEGGQIVVVIGQVQHQLVFLEGTHPVLALADVPLDELEPGRERGRPVMHRWREVVQDADLVPVPQQQLARSLADKAGAPGDQDLHCPGLYRAKFRDTAVTGPSRVLNGAKLS